jgi:hypothetical protein
MASSAFAGEADQTIDPRPGNSDSVYGSWEKNGPTRELTEFVPCKGAKDDHATGEF